MLIENRKTTPEENAYRQGIRKYSVVRLDEPGLVVPENIFISKAPNPAQAAQEMYWAVHIPPYDFATWMPDEETITTHLRKNIAKQMTQNPTIFEQLHFGIATHTENTAKTLDKIRNMRRKFKKFSNASMSEKETKLFSAWMETTLNTIESFAKGLENSRLQVAFKNGAGHDSSRNNGYKNIELHIDGNPQQTHLPEAIETQGLKIPFLRKIRTLWSQNDIGVFAANSKDYTLTLYPQDWYPQIRFSNTNPILYAAPPWSISMVPNRHHTRPSVHCSPIQYGGKPLKRLLWDLSVKFDKGATPAPDKDFLTEFQNRLEPLPLFK